MGPKFLIRVCRPSSNHTNHREIKAAYVIELSWVILSFKDINAVTTSPDRPQSDGEHEGEGAAEEEGFDRHEPVELGWCPVPDTILGVFLHDGVSSKVYSAAITNDHEDHVETEQHEEAPLVADGLEGRRVQRADQHLGPERPRQRRRSQHTPD